MQLGGGGEGVLGDPLPTPASPCPLSQKQSPPRKISSPHPLASLSGPGNHGPPGTQGAQKLLGSGVVFYGGLIKAWVPDPRAGAGQMPVTTPKPASESLTACSSSREGALPRTWPFQEPPVLFPAWKDVSGGPTCSPPCSARASGKALFSLAQRLQWPEPSWSIEALAVGALSFWILPAIRLGQRQQPI